MSTGQSDLPMLPAPSFNRAIWVDPDDAERLLVGSDGGVYQTFDAR
mgnify:CR=1 FL=1